MAVWYTGSTKYAAVATWAALHAYSIGDIVRQLATPAVGSERCFRTTTAGTSGAGAPSWNLTKASTTTDASVTWTEVTGNSTYGWNAPHARLANAFLWMAAGDDMYVSNNHAETQTGQISLVPPGTTASVNRCLCVNDSAAPPTALATTATVQNTDFANIVISSGFCYFYGISLSVSQGAGGGFDNKFITDADHGWFRFENCTIKLGCGASGTDNGRINIGSRSLSSGDFFVELVNTTLVMTNASHRINAKCRSRWIGGTCTAIATQTAVIQDNTNSPPFGEFYCEGVDFSSIGSGQSIINMAVTGNGTYTFVDCKLGASGTFSTGAVPDRGNRLLQVINSDNTNTNYRFFRQDYMSTEIQEVVIVRAGGASDGTTPFSRKVVTTANATVQSPYQSMPLLIFNSKTTSTTITVATITDGVTLQDNECWIEVEYLGTASFPLGTYATSRVSDPFFGSPASNPTDSTSTWTTTGLGSPVKQYMTVTVTPAHQGLIRLRVNIGKASTTLYYDPFIQVT